MSSVSVNIFISIALTNASLTASYSPAM